MKKYETVEHPSDIGIMAFGKSQKEAFENIAFGMMDIMYDLSKVEKKEKLSLKVEGEDLQSLVVNWLNELLYINDTKKMIFSEFKINNFSDKMLAVEAVGEKFDPKKHAGRLYVKAATYNQLELSKDKDNYKIKVIFDV